MRMSFPATMLLLAACSTGPTMMSVPGAGMTETETIYFLTTRAPTSTPAAFSEIRADEPTFGAVEVGIPPIHQIGQVETTDGVPDPSRHFHNAGMKTYADAGVFGRAIKAGDKPIIIFVHGFNNTFAESTFRFAQIVHDIDREGTPINLSWASRGAANGYIYDHYSAMLARDDLADLLLLISARPGQEVVLIAHSLGGLTVMEALLQLSQQGEDRALSVIDQIMLISPDLDEDLFAEQMRHINYPADQMVIAMNNRDRVLALSGRIAGNKRRVGRDMNPQELTTAGFNVFDVSGINDGDQAGHFLLATSPTLLGFMRALEGPPGSTLP